VLTAVFFAAEVEGEVLETAFFVVVVFGAAGLDACGAFLTRALSLDSVPANANRAHPKAAGAIRAMKRNPIVYQHSLPWAVKPGIHTRYPGDMPKQLFWRGGVCLALAAAAAFSQAPTASPAFEVASIKPVEITSLATQVQSGKMRLGMQIDGARVDIGFLSLADLIPMAFRVKPYQVSGPDWMRQERFDILAKIPEGVSKDQVPEMLQALLVERFKLTIHREKRDLPVYALVVGKNGPKLKESSPDDTASAESSTIGLTPPPLPPGPPPPPPGGPLPGPGRGGIVIGTPDGQVKMTQNGRGAVITGGPNGTMKMSMGENGVMRMEMSKATMAALADMIGPFVDRPVVDMTDLKGNYQVALELPMEDLMRMARARVPELAGAAGPGGGFGPGGFGPGTAPAGGAPAASDPSGTSIFQAVQQLGLRLEPRKAPVETIIIDHVEKAPTEN
jgi:hypothetical protein